MKMNSNFKKALSLLLCILVAFSTVSFAVGAASSVERVSEIPLYDSKDGHAHVYGNWEVLSAATCSKEGLKKRYCAVDGCDAFYERSIAIVADAHVYEKWTTVTESTCDTIGKEEAVCTECGHKEERIIKLLDHTLPEMYLPDGKLNPEWTVTIAPVHGKGLLTQQGYVRTNCVVCGTTVTEDYYGEKDAAGNYINWHKLSGTITVIKAPTCTTPGVGSDKCTVCGDTTSTTLAPVAGAHVYSGLPIVNVPATCSSEGMGSNQCTECKQVYEVVIARDPDAHIDARGNILEWKVDVPSRAHMDGEESVNCAVCGKQTRPIVADHELTDADYRITANANCVNPGTMIAQCATCHITVEKEIPVDNAHAWGEPEVLSVATCAQEGVQVRHCARHYGHVLYETTEKTEHFFSTPWETEVWADCNSAGREINKCVECTQDVTRVIPIIADAHNFVDDNGVNHDWTVVTEPTCTTVGIKENYCYECDKTVTGEIPMHTATQPIEISRKEATCTTEGEIFSKCSLCWAEIYDTIPVDESAHVFAGDPAVYVAPTCKFPGLGLAVCENCEKECTTTIPVDPDTHCDADGNVLEWRVVKEVSGCENGIEKVDCYYCGTLTRTIYSTHGIDIKNFSYYIYPTCEEDGVLRSKTRCAECEPCPGCKECPGCQPCKVCGDYGTCSRYVYIPVEKGHAGTLMSIERNATCTEDGLALYECARGQHLYYDIIPAKGHTAAQEYTIIKPASCTEEGKRQSSCSVCGEVYGEVETIPATHNYTSWTISKEATCNETGRRFRGCHDCEAGYQETTYLAAHTPGEWAYEEGYNCTTGGKLYRFCKTCNKLLGTKTVAKGEHGSTRTETTGATQKYCLGSKVVCNLCETVISQTNILHKTYPIAGQEGWAPTCTSYGMTSGAVCMVCGIVEKQEKIDPLGHKWEYDENGNKVCGNCGEYKVGNKDEVNNPDYDGACDCFCHDKGLIAKILYKVCVFFWKLLKMNQQCECGTVHWEAA